MTLLQQTVSLPLRRVQRFQHVGRGVGYVEIRLTGKQHHTVRRGVQDLAPDYRIFANDPDGDTVTYAAGASLTFHEEGTAADPRLGFRIRSAGQQQTKRAAGGPDRHHAVRTGNKAFPAEPASVLFIVRPADPFPDIQASAVFRQVLVPGELRIPVIPQTLQGNGLFPLRDQEQIAQRHVAALVIRDSAQAFVRHLLRLPDPAFPQQGADFFDRAAGIRIDAVAKTALPETVKIQLEAVYQGSSKAHGSKGAVSEGESFVPVLRGPVVPQAVFLHVPMFLSAFSRFFSPRSRQRFRRRPHAASGFNVPGNGLTVNRFCGAAHGRYMGEGSGKI